MDEDTWWSTAVGLAVCGVLAATMALAALTVANVITALGRTWA